MGLTEQGQALVAVGLVFPFISTFTVAGRFYSRWLMNARLQLDDWLCFVSLIAVYVTSFNMVFGALHAGYGLPVDQVYPKGPWVLYGKVYFVEKIGWEFTIATVKISALILYRRVFVGKKYRIPANILIGANIIWMVANIVVTILAFNPVEAFWTGQGDLRIQYGHFFLYVDITDILLDFIVLIFPVFAVGSLQISLKRKAAISSVFLVGFLSLLTSLIRIQYRTSVLDEDAQIKAGRPMVSIEDKTIGQFFIWTVLEINFALIAICMPTLGPIIQEGRNIANKTATIRSRKQTTRGSRLGDATLVGRSWLELSSTGNQTDIEHGGKRRGTLPGNELFVKQDDAIRVDTTWTVTSANHDSYHQQQVRNKNLVQRENDEWGGID